MPHDPSAGGQEGSASREGKEVDRDDRFFVKDLETLQGDVRDTLEAGGIRTRPQFGASRYRIDLVAMHPERPGRPVLAIECDGAAYHSSTTARDRDRLRQAHLHRLGWRLIRIWSTDWFYGREQETERVLVAYQEAVRAADVMDTEASDATPAPALAATCRPGAGEPPPRPVARERGPRPNVPARGSIDQYDDGDLRRLAEWILSDGLLRTDDELVREIFEALPFERLGSRIRERLEAIARAGRRRAHRP